jgi:hypothetical protein
MASMTRFSSSTERPRRRAGFTLVEVTVASSIFVMMIALLTGVIITQTKFGLSIGNYAEMNSASVKLLTQFDKDMRMAKTVTTMTSTEVVVQIVDDVDWTALNANPDKYWATVTAATPATVRYTFSTDGKLVREYTTATEKPVTTTLLTGLESGRFAYFNNDDDIANTTPSVKKIMISGTLKRASGNNSNSDYLVSAVVVMRSKSGTRTT